MAKKTQPIVYVPTSSNVPSINKNVEVPDYRDSGIQYLGYAKLPLGNGEYKLKKQESRFYASGIAPGNSSMTFTRPNANTHKFYITVILINVNFTNPLTLFQIFDTLNTNARFGIYCFDNTVTMQLNLSSAPRLFSGRDIVFEVDRVLGLGEYISFYILGFDEEI